MELPKKKARRLTKFYTITMTPEMKERLWELKELRDVDVANWVRSLIAKGLEDLDASL